MAYNNIYNEYYRDQNYIAEVNIFNNLVLNRAWRKDYFTSALPWQQRGTAPALPITGTGTLGIDLQNIYQNAFGVPIKAWNASLGVGALTVDDLDGKNALVDWLQESSTVQLDNATTFDVSDLRVAFQVQMDGTQCTFRSSLY